MEFDGKTFVEACRALGKDLPNNYRYRPKTPVFKKRQQEMKADEWRPAASQAPAGVNVELWQEKAGKLVDWANEQLLEDPEQLQYLAGRGIQKNTVEKFKLGFNPGAKGRPAIFRTRESWGLPTEKKEDGSPKRLWIPRGIIIPLIDGGVVRRIRIRRPSADLTPAFNTRYYVLPGSTMSPLMINPTKKAFVVIETELDAFLLDQAAGDVVGVLAMGSAATKPDVSAFNALRKADAILNALDYDQAGAKAMAWWADHLERVERWPVPDGKDPGEAFEKGVDLREWILAGLPPSYRIGRSALVGDEQGEAEPESREKRGVMANSPVVDLYELLKKYPVHIVSTADRLTIVEAKNWNNWSKSKQISDLVFLNTEVREFLMRHPERMIRTDNFWR